MKRDRNGHEKLPRKISGRAIPENVPFGISTTSDSPKEAVGKRPTIWVMAEHAGRLFASISKLFASNTGVKMLSCYIPVTSMGVAGSLFVGYMMTRSIDMTHIWLGPSLTAPSACYNNGTDPAASRAYKRNRLACSNSTLRASRCRSIGVA